MRWLYPERCEGPAPAHGRLVLDLRPTHPNTSAPVEPLPFTPEGLKAFNDVANLIDPTGRCVFPGIPRMNSSPYPMEIIQLQDRVVFLYEYMHNFRVIHTDGRGHRPNWEPSLMGDSVGWWEGDSLVIDTVGPGRPHLAGLPRQSAQRRAARHRALEPDQRQRVVVRGDDRRPQVLH